MPEETHDQKKSQDIVSLLKDYVSTRVELIRLSAIERVTVVTSGLITDIIVVVAGLLAFLFASLTLALFLGELLDSYAAGFGIMTLLYLIIAFIAAKKKSGFNKSLQDLIIKKIFDKKKK